MISRNMVQITYSAFKWDFYSWGTSGIEHPTCLVYIKAVILHLLCCMSALIIQWQCCAFNSVPQDDLIIEQREAFICLKIKEAPVTCCFCWILSLESEHTSSEHTSPSQVVKHWRMYWNFSGLIFRSEQVLSSNICWCCPEERTFPFPASILTPPPPGLFWKFPVL